MKEYFVKEDLLMSINSLFEIVWTMLKAMFTGSGYFMILSVGLCAVMDAAIVTLAVLLIRKNFKR